MFVVEHNTCCQGWVNTWTTDDDVPETFATREEAQAALDDFLAEVKQAFDDGDISGEYEPDEFRIVEVKDDQEEEDSKA